jgi:ABC-type amino acid transport system permease subunit
MNERSSPLSLLRSVDWNRFVAEHITKSGLLTVWLILLTAFTVNFIVGRLAAAPITTFIVLIIWAVTVSLTVLSEVRHKHTPLTWWLRNNLYNSITNILITVVLVLGILSVIFSLYRYAWETASFSRIPDTERRADSPERVADEFCFNVGGIDAAVSRTDIVNGEQQCFLLTSQSTDINPDLIGREAVTVCFDELPDDPENGESCFESSADNPEFFVVTNQFEGANWGGVAANMTTMMVFRYDRDELWRVYASLVLVIILLIPSQVVYRDSFPDKRLRHLVTVLWFLSPIIIFVLLRGVQPPPFPTDSASSVVRGLLGELFTWEATRLGNNLVNTLLFIAGAGAVIWLNQWAYSHAHERGITQAWKILSIVLDIVFLGAIAMMLRQVYYNFTESHQNVQLNLVILVIDLLVLLLVSLGIWYWARRYPLQLLDIIMVAVLLLTVRRFYQMVSPLFQANLHILALLLFLLCAAGWWLWNRRFPYVEGESGWSATVRTVLRAGFIIFGVMLAYTVVTLLGYVLGSFNRIVDGETRPLLSYVDPSVNWGGFLLTIIITVFALVVSFPLGLVLALGRRSQIHGIPAWLTYGVALIIMAWGLITLTPDGLAAARNTTERILAYWPIAVPILAYFFQRSFNGNVVAAFSTLYIEFIRGIPLIAVLFLTITLFPILLPPGVEILNTWRVLWGFALFSAAYLAENVRGGLQAIPKGQYEAADSLGLNTFDKYRLIILPQAIRIVIPALVGQFISLFKDTTLVAIVGLLDILGVANAISAQPQWLGVRREAYLFLAALYFVGSAIMVAYSRQLERRMGLGER